MKIMAIVTVVLLLCTLICGLWLRFSGNKVDPSSLTFHMVLGALTVLAGLITSGLVIFTK